MFQKQVSIQTRAGSCKEEIAGILIFRGYVEGVGAHVTFLVALWGLLNCNAKAFSISGLKVFEYYQLFRQ